MTVSELFEAEKIPKDYLSIVEDESTYWNSASSFILSNWNSFIDSMTPKQANWTSRILEDMVEKRINGEFK